MTLKSKQPPTFVTLFFASSFVHGLPYRHTMASSTTGRLTGKTAVVTGGGSGIGRAICQLFAHEGASVAVLDKNKAECEETFKSLSKNHDNVHCAITVDVSLEEQVIDSINDVKNSLGKLDVLVNAAGIYQMQSLTVVTGKLFQDVTAVNLNGTFLMVREFVRVFGEPGSIINISSIVGKTGASHCASYAASKAGVIGLTKSIAQEFARQNTRCNAVLPGLIKTPMTDVLPDEAIKKAISSIPMQRQGSPKEVADVCLFLASEESSYVTGIALEVTGGVGM